VAGPFDIQRIPKGLLDFLGLKATGDSPHTLEMSVRGQISLDRYYLADRSQNIAPTIAITANGYFTPATAIVPAGEMWLPMALRVSATNAAATSYQWAPAYRRAIGAGNSFQLTNLISAIASVTNEAVYIWDGLVPFLPGDTFGCYVQQSILGANPTASVILEYYRVTV
jgi:hypothetical protein